MHAAGRDVPVYRLRGGQNQHRQGTAFDDTVFYRDDRGADDDYLSALAVVVAAESD